MVSPRQPSINITEEANAVFPETNEGPIVLTFTASSSDDSETLSYQWHFRPTKQKNVSLVPFGEGSPMEIVGCQSMEEIAGYYFCVVSSNSRKEIAISQMLKINSFKAIYCLTLGPC
eukprot:m.305549 g.305549  ORF g.305549 m.305549 type:complete len:117 (+) comp40863_c0_seq5:5622-5972(+)